jgi:hypothetical protein
MPVHATLSGGIVPSSQLGSGTANSTTFLRGDGTYAVPPGGGGGVSDGDKGDITVTGTGTIWTIDAGVVNTAKMGGDVTTAGKALLDDADVAAQRTTLGLGSAATTASTDYAPIAHVGSGGTAHSAATGATAGFMSAADKTKLDGVATGATAVTNVTTTFVDLTGSASPGTPSAGVDRIFADPIISGLTVVSQVNATGLKQALQRSLAFSRVGYWKASSSAINPIGVTAWTTVGTITAVTPASGTAKGVAQRCAIQSAATAGALITHVSSNAGASPMMRGGVIGEGGFLFTVMFALQALQTGNRFFWGIADTVTASTNVDPLTSATPGKIGLACNASTGNWQFVNNVTATAPTVLDLGVNFPIDTTSLMELVLYCPPFEASAGNISYRVRRYTTNSNAPAFEATGTLSTNIPTATTLLHPYAFFTNNATAAAVSYHFVRSSVESDT